MNDGITVILAIKSMMTLLGELALAFMLPTLIIGLLVAIFQAATQINEQSLGLVLKLIALFVIIMNFSHMFLNKLATFTTELIQSIPTLVG